MCVRKVYDLETLSGGVKRRGKRGGFDSEE